MNLSEIRFEEESFIISEEQQKLIIDALGHVITNYLLGMYRLLSAESEKFKAAYEQRIDEYPPLDRRPQEEILAEIENIRKEIKKTKEGKNGKH